MLLGGKQSDIKQVAVVTRNLQLRQLLSSILSEWKIFTVEDLTEAKVVIAEHDVELPGLDAEVIWLSRQSLTGRHYLKIPISLTQLYKLLQTEYFPTPRRHIRLPLEKQVNVRLDDALQECRLVSLAERGGRIIIPNELPRGTMLELEMQVAGNMLQLPAEVLYSIPAGDLSCRALPQVGVLFRPADDRVISVLRNFIEKACVESACTRVGLSLDDPCPEWIDFVDEPWRELS